MKTKAKARLRTLVRKTNERNSIGYALTRKDIQITVATVKGKNILEAVSNGRISFRAMRKGIEGKRPSIIIARTSFKKPRYTIWAKDREILRRLRNKLNEKEYSSRHFLTKLGSHKGKGCNWGFSRDQEGEFLIKSPNRGGGTSLSPKEVKKTITEILEERNITIRQLPSQADKLRKKETTFSKE